MTHLGRDAPGVLRVVRCGNAPWRSESCLTYASVMRIGTRVRLPVLFALSALAALSGCGASARAAGETTPDDELDVGNRALTPPCTATYVSDNDITVVVRPWADDLMLGMVLPGDEWEGTCSEDPSALLSAEAEAQMRMATVTMDPTVLGDVNVVEYAAGQAARAVESLRAQGVAVEASEPRHLGDGIYVVTLRMTTDEGATLLQVHVYHVIPTANGLLRYHLSEVGDNAAVMNEHAATLLNAVRAFALTRP